MFTLCVRRQSARRSLLFRPFRLWTHVQICVIVLWLDPLTVNQLNLVDDSDHMKLNRDRIIMNLVCHIQARAIPLHAGCVAHARALVLYWSFCVLFYSARGVELWTHPHRQWHVVSIFIQGGSENSFLKFFVPTNVFRSPYDSLSKIAQLDTRRAERHFVLYPHHIPDRGTGIQPSKGVADPNLWSLSFHLAICWPLGVRASHIEFHCCHLKNLYSFSPSKK